MTVRYNIISYLISEGFKSLIKNKKSTFSALTIMCLCMLIFGIFFMIGENINHIMNTVQEAQGMQVFINVDVTSERMTEIGQKIQEIDGVSTVDFINREQAYNIMKETLDEGTASVVEGISKERIPESYMVTLTNLELNENVQNKIREIVGDDLDDLTSSNTTISTLITIGKGIRIFTFILLLILVAISIVIISNTIKLTVHARRKEISIMKYVGATNSFIRWPFIIEGIIIGVISSMIAILIVGVIYNLVINGLIQAEIVKKLEISFVTFSDMFNLVITIYMVLGIGIGVIGSSISMRKYLEV